MNADGTNIHQVSPTTYSYTDGGPEWSPDGSLIVFTGQPTIVTVDCPPCTEAEIGVYAMDTLGTTYGQFIQSENFQGAASWLADQTGVLFATDALSGTADLFASSYSVDGSTHPGNYFGSTAQLTSGWNVGESAASPDRQHIAFGGCNEASNDCGSDNLYVADRSGGHIVLVAKDVGGISWSPDETLFAVNNGYINSDGTNYVAVQNCPCRFAWK
jgi:Tol biopolymer transport system component